MNRRLVLPVLLVTLAVCVAYTPAHAQQRVSFGETGVSVEVPGDWSPFLTWSLTDNLPAFAKHHLQNQANGQLVAVHREQCPDEARRTAWAAGDLAAKQLDHRVDTIESLDAASGVHLDGGTGFVTTATREDAVYQSYAFFLAKGTVCYLVEVGGPQDLFATSDAVYQGLIDGLVLSE